MAMEEIFYLLFQASYNCYGRIYKLWNSELHALVHHMKLQQAFNNLIVLRCNEKGRFVGGTTNISYAWKV